MNRITYIFATVVGFFAGVIGLYIPIWKPSFAQLLEMPLFLFYVVALAGIGTMISGFLLLSGRR